MADGLLHVCGEVPFSLNVAFVAATVPEFVKSPRRKSVFAPASKVPEVTVKSSLTVVLPESAAMPPVLAMTRSA